MPVLANKTIHSVESKNVIEKILAQSKPVSKKSLKVKQIGKVYTCVQEKVDISKVIVKNSEEDESDEEAPITEELKVKPTSYLLQKPRSRSYNPIQLCKNPDFNTRLKRLTVGFFTSTRNRRLLKACMPLTIDLHKGFESKLIEGTLYLESSDAANVPVQIETKEDDHSEQASVLPSAMSIQCLMDATVSSCFSNQQYNDRINTVDLTSKCGADVSLKNKVINLYDLPEIKRINEQLLTAEVSPIPLDSETYTSTIPQLESPFEVHDAQQVNDKCVNEYSDAVPSSYSQTECFTTQSNDDECTVNDNNADNNLIVYDCGKVRGIGGSYRGRGRGRCRGYAIQRPPSMIPVPWNKPKKVFPANKSDDFLITIDTLNKMLNKMNGCDIYVNASKKNKKPNWVLEDKDIMNNEEEEHQFPLNDENPSSSPKKDPTPPRDVQIQKNPVVEKKPREKRPRRANQKALYCCWCNEKFHKMMTKSRVRQKHTCSNNTCECCCRFQLAEAMRVLGKRMQKFIGPPNNDSIVLSDEDDVSTNSISAPMPVIRVVNVKSMAKTKVSSIATQVDSINLCSDSSSGKQGEVNAAVDSILGNTTPPTLSNKGLHLTVGAVTSGDGESVCSVPVVSRIESTPESCTQDSHIPETSQSSPVSPTLTSKKKVVIWPHDKKPPILLKRPLVTIRRKHMIPKCYTVVSNSKSLKETQVKNDERVLFLSSKNIFNKQNQCPIFLGKNKILLSTVKMAKTDNAEVLLPSPTPLQETQTEVAPSLNLPQGVQLVLMPSGELTYTIEPGVTLTKEELLIIPNILSVVQQQIANQMQPISSIPISQDVQSAALPIDNANLVHDIAQETQPILENNQLSSQDAIISNLESAVNDSESNSTAVTTVAETKSNEQMTNLEGSSVIQNEIHTASISNDSTEQLMNPSEQERISSNISNVPNTSTDDNAKESETIDETTKSVPSISSTRNLLSDLMEMSGISVTDSLPAPQNLALEPAVAVTDKGIIENIPDMITRIAEHIPTEVLDVTAIPTSLEVPLPVTPSSAVDMPELTPISSLSELKYACNYNAQFFKFDLNTGIVVPINVAIKKSIKTRAAPVTKSIIDLTDDGDDETAITVSEIQNNKLSYQVSSDVMNKIPDVSSKVKPLRLFKTIRKLKAGDLKLQQIERRSTIDSNSRKRKQCFDKNEPTIDLANSQEHLLSSTDDEDTSSADNTRKALPNSGTSMTNSFDDSSDDEPLAVISKKMKEADICNNPTEERAPEESPKKESGIRNNTTEETIIENSVEKNTESTTSHSSKANDSQLKVKTGDGDEKMDTGEDTFLEEVEDNDAQDDCILGV